MALITFLSLYDFSDFDDVGLEIAYIDKLVHFVFYFVATIFGCLFLRERTSPTVGMQKAFVIVAIFMTFYGLLIELVQANFIEERSGEILDFISNLTGVVFGLLTVRFLFSPKTGLNWKY